MSAARAPVSSQWLRLRECADARARATELVDTVRRGLPAGRRAVIYDLGCGTGSMGRWLAPQLGGTQHWVLYDRDPRLLAEASADPPGAADGTPVTMAAQQRDITRLAPDDLAEPSLITGSALLDILTVDDLRRLVSACDRARCPVLVCLSVTGRVELTPADPLDWQISDAFNAHQRRTIAGRRLLGPDAIGHAVEAFTRHGADVLVRPSPWHLDTGKAADAALVLEWFAGWVGAACEQEPALTTASAAYAERRLQETRAGRLRVTVHHQDMLATPGRSGRNP